VVQAESVNPLIGLESLSLARLVLWKHAIHRARAFDWKPNAKGIS
jgi:hypothetical protein